MKMARKVLLGPLSSETLSKYSLRVFFSNIETSKLNFGTIFQCTMQFCVIYSRETYLFLFVLQILYLLQGNAVDRSHYETQPGETDFSRAA